jgi:RHS repeat-associated protein
VNMSGTTINYAYWPAPHGGQFYESGNGTAYNYIHPDWKGDTRVVSNLGHSVVTDQAFAPYGEVYSLFGTNNPPWQEFAGMDSTFFTGVTWETPNREYSYVGRWLSPDPAGEGWNQYAYPTNPNSFTDPSGLSILLTLNGVPTREIRNLQAIDPQFSGCEIDGMPASCQEALNLFESGGAYCIDGVCGSRVPIGGNELFGGQDCLSCQPLGPSPMDILNQVLSGNLAGALQNAGVFPMDGVDCTSGVCMPSWIMDAQQDPRKPCAPGAGDAYFKAVQKANRDYDRNNLKIGAAVGATCIGALFTTAGAGCVIALGGGAAAWGINYYVQYEDSKIAKAEFLQKVNEQCGFDPRL